MSFENFKIVMVNLNHLKTFAIDEYGGPSKISLYFFNGNG